MKIKLNNNIINLSKQGYIDIHSENGKIYISKNNKVLFEDTDFDNCNDALYYYSHLIKNNFIYAELQNNRIYYNCSKFKNSIDRLKLLNKLSKRISKYFHLCQFNEITNNRINVSFYGRCVSGSHTSEYDIVKYYIAGIEKITGFSVKSWHREKTSGKYGFKSYSKYFMQSLYHDIYTFTIDTTTNQNSNGDLKIPVEVNNPIINYNDMFILENEEILLLDLCRTIFENTEIFAKTNINIQNEILFYNETPICRIYYIENSSTLIDVYVNNIDYYLKEILKDITFKYFNADANFIITQNVHISYKKNNKWIGKTNFNFFNNVLVNLEKNIQDISKEYKNRKIISVDDINIRLNNFTYVSDKLYRLPPVYALNLHFLSDLFFDDDISILSIEQCIKAITYAVDFYSECGINSIIDISHLLQPLKDMYINKIITLHE